MIDNKAKYDISVYCTLGLNCLFLFFLQRTPGLSLKIGTATPVILIPFIITIACFLREWAGFWFGFFCGISLDVFTLGSRCFNTVCLLIIGTLAGLLYHYIFNRNIKSVIIGGVGFSFVYCISRWIYLTVFGGDSSAMIMLVRYELPSALYTALFTVPFFYYIRWLTRRHLIHNN